MVIRSGIACYTPALGAAGGCGTGGVVSCGCAAGGVGAAGRGVSSKVNPLLAGGVGVGVGITGIAGAAGVGRGPTQLVQRARLLRLLGGYCMAGMPPEGLQVKFARSS